ncbi:hypothetical protein CQ10_08200, partial [Bradyrhizobium valentinum]
MNSRCQELGDDLMSRREARESSYGFKHALTDVVATTGGTSARCGLRTGSLKYHATDPGPARFFSGRDRRINCAANDAMISQLRVADDAGLVDVFRREPSISNRRRSIPVWKSFWATCRDFPPLLRRIVFVGEA